MVRYFLVFGFACVCLGGSRSCERSCRGHVCRLRLRDVVHRHLCAFVLYVYS